MVALDRTWLIDWILIKFMKKINLPTKITILRIILGMILIFGFVILYLFDEFDAFSISSLNFKIGNLTQNWILIIAFVIFLVASITDCIDGNLARKMNLVTNLGKFLDPLADKILINALMIFLIFNFKSLEGFQTIPWFCVVLMVVRDLAVDGLRFMAASRNVVIAANFWGKFKTVFQMISIGLVLINGFPFKYFDYNFPTYLSITNIFIYITTFISLYSGFRYLKDNKKVFGK